MAAARNTSIHPSGKWRGTDGGNPVASVKASSSKKPGGTRSMQKQLQKVNTSLDATQKVGKQGVQESPSRELGRHRSVSFDSTYFQNVFPQDDVRSFSPTSGIGPSHLHLPVGIAAKSRLGPASSYGSSSRSDRLSANAGPEARQRARTLNLPEISRKHGSDAASRPHHHHHHLPRNHHPLLMGWRGASESHTSLASGSTEVSSYPGRRHGHRHRGQKVKLGNTYQLTPRINFHYREGKIRIMVDDYLEGTLSNLASTPGSAASAEDAASAAAALSEAIKDQVKYMNLPRYKIVCMAMVARRLCQSLVSCSRSLWNTETDGFVSVTRQTKQWFGEVTLYAVYLE